MPPLKFACADSLEFAEQLEAYIEQHELGASRPIATLVIHSDPDRRWGSISPLLFALGDLLRDGCAVRLAVGAASQLPNRTEARWRKALQYSQTVRLNAIESHGATGRRNILRVTVGSTEVDVPREVLSSERGRALVARLQPLQDSLRGHLAIRLRAFSGTGPPLTAADVVAVLAAMNSVGSVESISFSEDEDREQQLIGEYRVK